VIETEASKVRKRLDVFDVNFTEISGNFIKMHQKLHSKTQRRNYPQQQLKIPREKK